MMNSVSQSFGCEACTVNEPLGFAFSMALQPIVNIATGTIFVEKMFRVPGLGAYFVSSIDKLERNFSAINRWYQ